MKTETEDDTETLRNKTRQYVGRENIMCLHTIAQPLVDEMQKVIRFQQSIIDRQKKAIEYVLLRVRDDKRAANVFGCGTQSFSELTAAMAAATGINVDEVRNQVLPGSASMHRER